MSIDQQSRSDTDSREPEAQRQADSNESAKKRAIDLSPSQVLGGALAAMTAAAIGSRLGAAGTIIGAAAASVVAAVAGAVYTASLRHTHAKVRTVWSGRWSSGIPGTVEVISDRADATAANAGPQHTAPRRRGTAVPRPFANPLEASRGGRPAGVRHCRCNAHRTRVDLRSCAVRWRRHDGHPGEPTRCWH